MTVLALDRLSVGFVQQGQTTPVVDAVSFQIESGETLGLVGESGCGKSLTATAIMGLLPKPYGQVLSGDILFQGQSLVRMAPSARQHLRGAAMAMVFQEPMTALNPVQRVGPQLAEMFHIHRPNWGASRIQKELISRLESVGIQDPVARLACYPHELSGGMRQRMMIAMALSLEPQLLICDEPTTALDVTIQAQVLDLIRTLSREHGTSVLFITHDLGVIAELADRVAVMYGGQLVEMADVNPLFETPAHPYTQGLLASIPTLDGPTRVALPTIEGQVPQAGQFPSGCRFRSRCTKASDKCLKSPVFDGRVACFHAETAHA